MTIFWHFTLLANKADEFMAMGDHFRADSAHVNIAHLLVLALVVLSIASMIWALTRWQEHDFNWGVDNPQKLFLDLCKQHELSTAETNLLRRVCRELQLAQPASLFVDPGLLISAMRLEKYRESQAKFTDLGENFFGYHLWRQALAADQNQHHEHSRTV
ncbi:hypothetical protein GC197_06775 [bacterium]|nr:hypothetical protein [bacterium]